MAGTESRRRTGRLIIGAVVLAGVAIVWAGRGDFTPADSGRMAPAYTAETLDGQPFDIESMRGQVVVLNVWATWCRPCVTEMPALQNLWERNRDAGLVVAGISVDNPALVFGNVQDVVRTFVADHGITFPIVLDVDNRIEAGYPVIGLPTTYVIDRDGRIVERTVGPRAWDSPEVESQLRTLLES